MSVFESIEKHEGFRAAPYPDSKGLWTVGIGRCLETNPLAGSEWAYLLSTGLASFKITKAGADWLVERQVNEILRLLHKSFVWFEILSPVRKDILVEMCYQIGSGFFEFDDMFAALKKHDYASAAKHGLNSKWAKKDSPSRAREMMKRLESGE